MDSCCCYCCCCCCYCYYYCYLFIFSSLGVVFQAFRSCEIKVHMIYLAKSIVTVFINPFPIYSNKKSKSPSYECPPFRSLLCSQYFTYIPLVTRILFILLLISGKSGLLSGSSSQHVFIKSLSSSNSSMIFNTVGRKIGTSTSLTLRMIS